MKTPEPTKLDPEYYPRIKHNRRWYLIVPEISYHDGCAFHCPDIESDCKTTVASSTNGLPVAWMHDR
jgi:hypothetical protein